MGISTSRAWHTKWRRIEVFLSSLFLEALSVSDLLRSFSEKDDSFSMRIFGQGLCGNTVIPWLHTSRMWSSSQVNLILMLWFLSVTLLKWLWGLQMVQIAATQLLLETSYLSSPPCTGSQSSLLQLLVLSCGTNCHRHQKCSFIFKSRSVQGQFTSLSDPVMSVFMCHFLTS